MDVSENRGVSPQIIHWKIGFSIILIIHFGDFPTFGSTPKIFKSCQWSQDFMRQEGFRRPVDFRDPPPMSSHSPNHQKSSLQRTQQLAPWKLVQMRPSPLPFRARALYIQAYILHIYFQGGATRMVHPKSTWHDLFLQPKALRSFETNCLRACRYCYFVAIPHFPFERSPAAAWCFWRRVEAGWGAGEAVFTGKIKQNELVIEPTHPKKYAQVKLDPSSPRFRGDFFLKQMN